MQELKKILLATDFQPPAEDALRAAMVVAKAFRSTITPIHVIPIAPETEGFVDMRAVHREAANQLEHVRREITQQRLPADQSIVTSGRPFEQIVDVAERAQFNVVFIGSSDYEHEEGNRLAITTQRVIRRSTRPVWVARRGHDGTIRRIMCAVDLSEPSARAMRNAIMLARVFKAELAVVYVVKPIDTLQTLWWGTSAGGRQKHFEHCSELFEQFLSEHQDPAVPLDPTIASGDIVDTLLTEIDAWHPDLLLMGATGSTGLENIFLGSTAESVLRHLPCSVVTLKSNADLTTTHRA